MKFKIEGSEFTIEEILYHISKGRSGHFKQLIIDALSTLERERDELRACHASFAREADSTKAELRTLREWIKTVEAERDKAFAWHSSLLKKYEPLEAELRLRDAAAGEPVAVLYRNGDVLTKAECGEYFEICCKVETPLYTAAPPAVLPPKYADELKDRAELIEAYSKTQCEIAQELGCDSDNESILKAIYAIKELGAQPAVLLQSDIDRIVPAIDPNGLDEAIHYIEHALYVDRERIRSELKALGAQQQKVVELPMPFDVEINLTRTSGDIEYQYHESGENFDRDEILAVLDSANVKWELKP